MGMEGTEMLGTPGWSFVPAKGRCVQLRWRFIEWGEWREMRNQFSAADELKNTVKGPVGSAR